MKVSSAIYALFLVLALSSNASGQVYQSRDADGNTVFSDRPSEGSHAIEVPPTNSADPVADIPKPSRPATAPATPTQTRGNGVQHTQREHENDDDYIYYPGGAVNGDQAQQRRQELQERGEEGASKPGREPPAQIQPHRNIARPAGGGGGRR